MARFYNGTATIDEQMSLRKADEGFYKFVGQDIYGTLTQSVHPEDFHRLQEALDELKAKDMPQNIVSARVKRYDGKYRWVLMELSYEPFDIDGKALINIKLQDLAESEDSNSELRRINNEYDTYLSLMDGIMLCYDMDTEQMEIFMSGSGQRMNLYQGSLQEWRESVLKDKIEPADIEDFEALCSDLESGKRSFSYDIRTNIFTRKGEMDFCTFKCQTIRSVARSHKVLGCITVYGKDKDKEMLLGMAYNKDASLDVLNKKAITDYAKKVMSDKEKRRAHLVVLDLDNFKTINDTLGHMFGDEVLVTVSEILKEAVGNQGVVGRIGGDEMMIILDKVEDHAELRNILRTIRTNIEWAYKGKRDDVNLSCSMGVATFPDHGGTYEKIFQIADKMLYRAKEKGKNRYVIYIPEVHDVSQKPEQGKNADQIAKYQANKIGVLYHLIESFLVRKVITYETALNEIGYAFDLDEIIMIYEHMSITTTWNHQGVFSGAEDINFLRKELGENTEFLMDFDENNIFVANGLFNLEGKYPAIAGMMKSRENETSLFYKIIKQGRIAGFVIFSKKTRRQQWSEYEKTILSVIGKIMDISISDR